MKVSHLLPLLLAGVLSAVGNDTGPKIHVNIVGEVYASGYSQPSSTAPAYYVYHDAGFFERGDPIGGDVRPSATDVTQALGRCLSSANFLPASEDHAPTLLLVSIWGSLRADSTEIAPPFEIRKSLRARIRLVATPELAESIEEKLTDRLHAGRMRSGVSSMLSKPERDTLDIARDGHYFLVVTAYDYAAAVKKQVVPVWRLKLSTYDLGVSMPKALPALLRHGRDYFGRSTTEPINDKMPLYPEGKVTLGEAEVLGFEPPAPAPSAIGAEDLQIIQQAESSLMAGAKAAPAAEAKPESPPQ